MNLIHPYNKIFKQRSYPNDGGVGHERTKKRPCVLPTIYVNGTKCQTKTVTKQNCDNNNNKKTSKSQMSLNHHNESHSRGQKVRSKGQQVVGHLHGYHGNSSDVTEVTRQYGSYSSRTTTPLQDLHSTNPTPYRFTFNNASNNKQDKTDTAAYAFSIVTDSDRENMYSRERTMGNFNIQPDKENLSELQIVVGDILTKIDDNARKQSSGKRRLLRKPLPFSHYKKSQKPPKKLHNEFSYSTLYKTENFKPKTESLKPKEEATASLANAEEDGLDIDKESKKMVSNWLYQIDYKMKADQQNSRNVDEESCSQDDEKSAVLVFDTDDAGVNINDELKKIHNKKYTGISGRKTKKKLLPDILSASPESQVTFQPHFDVDIKRNSGINLPDIRGTDHNNIVNLSRHKEGDQNEGNNGYEHEISSMDSESEDEDYFLPQLLLDEMSQDKDGMERERLHLMNLHKASMGRYNKQTPLTLAAQSSRSEPPFHGNMEWLSQGTSSRTTAKKQLSLRDMAAPFQSRMGYAVESPTKIGDRMWRERITKHSGSVIDNEKNYDMFARKFTKVSAQTSVAKPSIKESETVDISQESVVKKPIEKDSKIVMPLQVNTNTVSDLSKQSHLSKSTESLAKMRYSFKRENSTASLYSSGDSFKREHSTASSMFSKKDGSGVRKTRRHSIEADIAKLYKKYRSDSNLSVSSKQGSKKGSSVKYVRTTKGSKTK